jgi:hypothetical protein
VGLEGSSACLMLMVFKFTSYLQSFSVQVPPEILLWFALGICLQAGLTHLVYILAGEIHIREPFLFNLKCS